MTSSPEDPDDDRGDLSERQRRWRWWTLHLVIPSATLVGTVLGLLVAPFEPLSHALVVGFGTGISMISLFAGGTALWVLLHDDEDVPSYMASFRAYLLVALIGGLAAVAGVQTLHHHQEKALSFVERVAPGYCADLRDRIEKGVPAIRAARHLGQPIRARASHQWSISNRAIGGTLREICYQKSGWVGFYSDQRRPPLEAAGERSSS